MGIEATGGDRWRFDSWEGDVLDALSASTTVVMDADKSIMANWQERYRLTLDVSPAGTIAVDGEGWYDGGAQVMMGEAPDMVDAGAGTRHVFSSWSVDGAEVAGNPVAVVMDSDHSVVAVYTTQHYLEVASERGDPQGEGWYDAGSTVQVSVTESPGVLIRGVFEGWGGDLAGTEPTVDVLMEGPRTLVAVWRTDYTFLYGLVGLLCVLGVAATFGILLWRRRSLLPPGPSPDVKHDGDGATAH